MQVRYEIDIVGQLLPANFRDVNFWKISIQLSSFSDDNHMFPTIADI